MKAIGPERALISAALNRAICDALGETTDIPQHVSRAAFLWICERHQKDEEPSEWSFEWMCEQLDIEPDVFRRHFKREVIKVYQKDCKKSQASIQYGNDRSGKVDNRVDRSGKTETVSKVEDAPRKKVFGKPQQTFFPFWMDTPSVGRRQKSSIVRQCDHQSGGAEKSDSNTPISIGDERDGQNHGAFVGQCFEPSGGFEPNDTATGGADIGSITISVEPHSIGVDGCVKFIDE